MTDLCSGISERTNQHLRGCDTIGPWEGSVIGPVIQSHHLLSRNGCCCCGNVPCEEEIISLHLCEEDGRTHTHTHTSHAAVCSWILTGSNGDIRCRHQSIIQTSSSTLHFFQHYLQQNATAFEFIHLYTISSCSVCG